MIRNTLAAAALITAVLLIGCGTSSTSPGGGSKGQATTGVSVSGYPAGAPKDAGSPALASSTEAQYSRDQKKEGETGKKGTEPAK
ncbi:MAG TPA: hypothetical protein VN519_15560 [Bryobacteraceae bacterium]|nr:hypothetical protein [Bryobacteraceae bacterium]